MAVNLSLPTADLRGRRLDHYLGGPWGWTDTLALDGSTAPITLGEGNSPTVDVGGDDDASRLALKLEGSNPTGSHKDRAMSVAVTRAVEVGATTVVAASSGNAGAAAAAYAARAGLRCVVLTTTGVPSEMHAQIVACGAALLAFPDSFARNRMMQAAVEDLAWFPVTNFVEPGPGSNPYAIEGYKSVAYEIARDLVEPPEVVVVPTSRADLLAGISKGFRELLDADLIARRPRLVAAEPATGAAFTAALATDDPAARERTQIVRHPSPAISVGGDVANWQGLDALSSSSGWAEPVEERDYLAVHRAMAMNEGIFMEPSSAVGVAVAQRVLSSQAGSVLAIVTAGGLKDHRRGFSDGTSPSVEVHDEDLGRLVATVDRQLREPRA